MSRLPADGPLALLLFYRSALLSGDTAPVEALFVSRFPSPENEETAPEAEPQAAPAVVSPTVLPLTVNLAQSLLAGLPVIEALIESAPLNQI